MDDSNFILWEHESDSNYNEIIEGRGEIEDLNEMIEEQVEGYEEVNILEERQDDDETYFIDEEIIPAPAQVSLSYFNDDKLVNKSAQIGVGRSHLIEQRVEEAENKIIGDRDAHEDYQAMVVEEVIAGGWPMEGEEVQVAMEQVVSSDNHYNEDDSEIVPLNIDQDEYTTQRPYPCDFCSRRFRKKANLMNHIISHQNERPHVCNLCGSRYVRKCDLINHLKIHAYNIQDDALIMPSTSGGKKKPKFDPEELDFLTETYEDIPDDIEEFDYNHHYSKSPIVPNKPTPMKKKKPVAKSGKLQKKTQMKFEKLSKARTVPKEISITFGRHEEEDDEEEEPPTVHEYVERFPITDPRKPFVCQHCGVAFTREKALESHTKLHASQEPTHDCEVCGDSFFDSTSLEEHLELRHNFSSRIRRTGGKSTSGKVTPSAKALQMMDHDDDSNSEYDPLKNDDSSVDEDEEVDFTCDQCTITFKTAEQLKRHIRLHNIKTEVMSDDDDMIIKKKDGTNLDCNVCGESFTEPLDLLAHAEIHARFQPFKCQLCGETFFEENKIKMHLMGRHQNELTDSSCRLCGKQCRDQRSLIKHSWEHSREKNHPCSKCGKTFHNKARLKRHISSHRNKSVMCEVCHEEFPDGRQLMNHRHSHTKANQFPCHECGKTFGSRSSQQIHIRIHTGERPYGCRFCWKAFADGGTLRKHERIHTGEKPYCCLVCPRAFNQRVVLREHIRSHHSGPDPLHGTASSPYYCSLCGDLFAVSTELIQHLIEHSDRSTAAKRVQPTGPRKYKRRRKINGDVESVEFNPSNGTYQRIKSESEAPMIKKSNIFSKLFRLPENPTVFNLPEEVFHSAGRKVPDRKSTTVTSPMSPPAKSAKMIYTQKTKIADGKRKSKMMIERQVMKPVRLTQRQLEKQRKMLEKEKAAGTSQEDSDGGTSETWSNDPNEDVLDTLMKRERKLSEKYTIDLVNDLQEILRSPIKSQEMFDDSPSTSGQPKRRSERQTTRKLVLNDSSPEKPSAKKEKTDGAACEICNATFDTKSQLSNHVKIHIG